MYAAKLASIALCLALLAYAVQHRDQLLDRLGLRPPPRAVPDPPDAEAALLDPKAERSDRAVAPPHGAATVPSAASGTKSSDDDDSSDESSSEEEDDDESSEPPRPAPEAPPAPPPATIRNAERAAAAAQAVPGKRLPAPLPKPKRLPPPKAG